MISYKLFSGILLISAILMTGCAKEGCTDEDAENYNITADEDDGSCIYCTSFSEQFIGSDTNSVIDSRFSSPFHDEIVLSINIATKQVAYPMRNCGEDGCFLIVTATNITDAVITDLQFNIPVAFQGFWTNSFSFGPLEVLNPGDSHTFTDFNLQSVVGVDCPELALNQPPGMIYTASYE